VKCWCGLISLINGFTVGLQTNMYDSVRLIMNSKLLNIVGLGVIGTMVIGVAGSDAAIENMERQFLVDDISPEDLDYYGLNQAPDEDRFFRAYFTFDSFFDSNIFLSNTNEQSDWVNQLRPGIELFTNQSPLNAEHYFEFGYSPEFILFLDNDEENTINHFANALYRYNARKGFLEASHDFALVEAADRDVGNRTAINRHHSKILGEYTITDKLGFMGDAAQVLRYYDNQNDRHSWHVGGFLMYQIFPKTKVGVGTKIGWLDIQNSPNQTYQQALGRIIWEPSSKVTLDARFGADFRDFHQGNARGDRTSPAGSLEAIWRPFAKTAMSLMGYYNVEGSSAINNSNFDVVGFQAKIRQNVSDKVAVLLLGGYENADYYSTLQGFTSNREDDYFFIRGSVLWQPCDWVSVEPFYRYSNNDSSLTFNAFDRHQAGIQATFEY
jgi:hypothetical protein